MQVTSKEEKLCKEAFAILDQWAEKDGILPLERIYLRLLEMVASPRFIKMLTGKGVRRQYAVERLMPAVSGVRFDPSFEINLSERMQAVSHPFFISDFYKALDKVVQDFGDKHSLGVLTKPAPAAVANGVAKSLAAELTRKRKVPFAAKLTEMPTRFRKTG